MSKKTKLNDKEIKKTVSSVIPSVVLSMIFMTIFSYLYYGMTGLNISIVIDIIIILFALFLYIVYKRQKKLDEKPYMWVDKWISDRKNNTEQYKKWTYLIPLDSVFEYGDKNIFLSKKDKLELLSKRKEYGITDPNHKEKVDCKTAFELNEELLKRLVKEELLDEI